MVEILEIDPARERLWQFEVRHRKAWVASWNARLATEGPEPIPAALRA